MGRWSHGHSLGLGALVSLAFLSDHLLWSLTAAFTVGVAVGRGWGMLGHLLRQVSRLPWRRAGTMRKVW